MPACLLFVYLLACVFFLICSFTDIIFIFGLSLAGCVNVVITKSYFNVSQCVEADSIRPGLQEQCGKKMIYFQIHPLILS